jgi:hypothetical protein
MRCPERILTSKDAQALLDIFPEPELESRKKSEQGERPHSNKTR